MTTRLPVPLLVGLSLSLAAACSNTGSLEDRPGGAGGHGGGAGGGGTGDGGTGGGGTGGGAGEGGTGGAPQPQLEIYGLAYGNGIYVATGVDDQTNRGVIYASADGLAWQGVASGLAAYPWGVAYGNGRFVAVGSRFSSEIGGLITQAFASVDGRTWTTTDLPWQATGISLAFGDGQFVAAGQASHFRSTDGVSWTSFGPAGLGYLSGGVVFAAGRFLSWGRGSRSVAVFTNGTWSSAAVSTLDDLRFVGDRFVGVTKFDCCLGEQPSEIRWGRVSTADGIAWTTEQTGLTARPPQPVFDDGSVCIAFWENSGALPVRVQSGATCDALTAVDGADWFHLFTFLHAGGLFVASGQYGLITSSDGRVWTRRL